LKLVILSKPVILSNAKDLLLSVALAFSAITANAQVAPPDDSPAPAASSTPEIVMDMTVRGNAKVESDAILTLIKTRKADALDRATLQDDIRKLYELGYFSDVRVFKKSVDGGVQLIFQVAEKPAIVSIEFEGNEEVTDDNIKEKLETKLYTIVNEATITSDVRMIEKQYAEKGYYLARVTYKLDKKGANEVDLTFHVEEGGKVLVGDVSILGNKFFTDVDIISGTPGLASRPFTRSSAYSSASLYQDDFVKRDLEYISFIYRDQGFAEVKVAKPFQFLDTDRDFVRLTFQIEEGTQYNVGTIDVSGDLLFTKDELFEAMKLKPGDLFRHSRFVGDVDMLSSKYGDLGYAYVDVNPKTKFDREKKLVHIDYEITKGEKVYFGTMTILGNTKTRDNVIRREFEIADSELYHGTGLSNSKNNINRLGYFEEVQIIKQRDEEQTNLLNLDIKVKEKATGQLQAAVGFTPNNSGSQGSQWFGQGRYDEKNQSGKGWGTNLSGKWNGQENYSLDFGFSNPRVNDSQWSAGNSLFYSNERRKYLDDVDVVERRIGGSVFVGRKVIELIRATVRYRLQRVERDSGGQYVLSRFTEDGLSSSMIFSLSRVDVDNYLDATEGTDVTLSQNFTGGDLLKGDNQYMESSLDATVYYPIDFSEQYRTYFKLHGLVSYIYPMAGEPVPFSERYRLGGYNDMRGFGYYDIGPHFTLLRAPGGSFSEINKGGDKKMYYQLEYFLPLIPEAGIKALLFTDIGRVYDDDETIVFSDFEKDVGFGFRWITPIAPFRFEWAYPIVDGELGDMEIIFYIGY
jgi:outer membrane protein insertion porin family